MPRSGRQPTRGLEPRDCVVCGARFQPYRDYNVTCSQRACRERAKARSPRLVVRTIHCRYCDTDFEREWSGIGRPPPCDDCGASRARERAEQKNVARRLATAKDPEARREMSLRSNLRQYGITLEQYREMLAAQDGKCAICGATPPPNGVKSAARLHVDHDHVTKRVRALLCSRCNQGIGYFKDDPDLFHAAARYIEQYRVEPTPEDIEAMEFASQPRPVSELVSWLFEHHPERMHAAIAARASLPEP